MSFLLHKTLSDCLVGGTREKAKIYMCFLMYRTTYKVEAQQDRTVLLANARTARTPHAFFNLHDFFACSFVYIRDQGEPDRFHTSLLHSDNPKPKPHATVATVTGAAPPACVRQAAATLRPTNHGHTNPAPSTNMEVKRERQIEHAQ